MNETFIISAAQGSVSSFSSHSHAGQVRPILQELFEKSGAPARRVEAIHWHGGDQEFWLGSLGGSPRVGEAQESGPAFVPEVARFQWPTVPLLAHASLQSVAWAIEREEANLVLLAQETDDQAVALLLASPAAVGVYNLSPRARITRKLALSSLPDGLVKAASKALKKTAGDDAENAEEDVKQPTPADVQWLVAAKRLVQPSQAEADFPTAQWLMPDRNVPSGDFFLLNALMDRLVAEKAQWGMLLSEGPQKSGLATLVERL